jgi:hypothetical protein
MARYLVGTELLISVIAGQTELTVPMDEIAISLLSLEWFQAELDGENIEAHERQWLRTNTNSFRQQLVNLGGELLGISDEAIEAWGRLHRGPLADMDQDEEPLQTMELLVIATADAAGLIYLFSQPAWAANLEVAGVAHELIS